MFTSTVRAHSPSNDSPTCHEDRLFHDLSKYTRSKHATQLIPKHNEFAMGQGDPLLEAAMEYDKHQAIQSSHRQLEIEQLEIEDKGSHRREQQQHRRRSKQKSLPSMSQFQMQLQTQKDDDECNSNQIDHLIQHGSPFASIVGMNDAVHLPDGTVVTVPCIDPKMIQQITSKRRDHHRRHHRRRHTMPHWFRHDKKHSPHDDDNNHTKKQHDDEEGRHHHNSGRMPGLNISDVVHIGDKVMMAPVGIV